MASVTVLSADRMLEIEAASVVDGDVVGDQLILTRHDGSTINAGNVRGPQGSVGTPRFYTDLARASALLEMSSTNVDIPGCSLTVPVVGIADEYSVTACVDAQGIGTTSTLLVVELLVNGAVQPGQAIWSSLGISGNRATIFQQWTVDGLSNGNKIFKLQGRRAGGADSMVRSNSTHTTLKVTLDKY